MWLTTLAIRRPLVVLMAISGVLIVGLIAWPRLPVDLLPSIDAPIVVVTTPYPGASPEAVDGLITNTIERAIAGLNNIDHVESTSVEGASKVIIFFTERASPDSSLDVERRISGHRDELPSGAGEPVIAKFDPNAQPLVQLTLSSRAAESLARLQDVAEQTVQKRLQTVPGVGQVTLVGGQSRDIQVRVDAQRLAAHGLSIKDVERAIAEDNVQLPAGTVSETGTDLTIRFDNRAQTPSELGDALIVRPAQDERAGASGPVYVRDVATVVDTVKPTTTIERTNGSPGLGILVFKQSSANAVETADAVRITVQDLQAELPSDVTLSVSSDASFFTRRTVADVQRELGQAVVVTGVILLLFLHSLRNTFIVLLAIPSSLIATVGVMYVLGLTLNTMSLMGLTLTVGILVDDSIVVLENIAQHVRRGERPLQAAVNGRAEIGFAAIAITLVDVVVFAPIAFMTGVVGQYARPFGLVVVAATLFSLIVSFTLTPLLASRWNSAGSPHIGRVWERAYAHLVRRYEALLRIAINPAARWVVVAVGALAFGAGVLLVTTGVVSTEFFPEVDTGQLQVSLQMPAATTLEVTDVAARRLEQQLMAWPEVRHVFTTVGFVGGTPAAGATLQAELTTGGSGLRRPAELAQAAQALATEIPGARISANPIRPFGGPAAWNVQVRIQGEDQTVLARLAQQVAAVVRGVAGTTDVDDGGVTGQPELLVSVDRQRAGDLGLVPADVARELRTALSGSTASTFYEGRDASDIDVIMNPAERSRLEQVADMPVLRRSGASVPLREIATLQPRTGPTRIDRRDGQRTVVVSASGSGRALGDVTRDVQLGLDRISVPAGYKVAQGGVAENQRNTFSQVLQALALSVLLIYMLLVALFENLLYPLIVLLSLPVSVVGAVGLLALTGNSLNTLSLIGMILLTGLAGKNAILLVDFTNSLRQRGLARDAALLAAGPTRLRPILMTTCALVVAMLPTALRLGAASEWRAPMAVTVIGGLITSTLLTLVLIPSVYTILDDVWVTLARVRPIRPALPGRVQHPLRSSTTVPLLHKRRVAAAARDVARNSAGHAHQVHRRSGG